MKIFGTIITMTVLLMAGCGGVDKGLPTMNMDSVSPIGQVDDSGRVAGMSAPPVDGFEASRGTVVYAFVSKWCSDCLRESQILAEWDDETMKQNDIELVLVVTLDGQGAQDVDAKEWVAQFDFPEATTIIFDDADNSLAKLFGVSVVPTFVVAGDGKMFSRTVGPNLVVDGLFDN